MGQGLGLLGRELEASPDSLGGSEVEDEGQNLHLGTAKRAQQRVDLVHAANQLRPGEARAAGELIVVVPAGRSLDRVIDLRSLAAFAAGSVSVEAPIANHLLRRLRDVVNHPGEELEHIPAGSTVIGSGAARGSATVEDFSHIRVPAQTLQDDRTADHVPPEAHCALPVLHSHRAVCREAAVAPGQKVVDDRLADQLLGEQHSEHFRAKEPFNMLGVKPGERPEGAVRRETAIRHEHVEVWVEVEKLSRGLQEAGRARSHIGAVKVAVEVELQGSPGTAGQPSQELAVVAEEDSKPLGNREDHLAVRDILEQFLLGPVRPQKLALLVAAWAQAPELAREGDQELMPAVRAAHPGNTLVEDAAVEVAVYRRLDAAAQIAAGVEEALFIHLDEVLEVMGQSAVEDRALGTTWAIDLRARSCRDCLHPDGEDESGGRDLAVESRRQGSEGP